MTGAVFAPPPLVFCIWDEQVSHVHASNLAGLDVLEGLHEVIDFQEMLFCRANKARVSCYPGRGFEHGTPFGPRC